MIVYGYHKGFTFPTRNSSIKKSLMLRKQNIEHPSKCLNFLFLMSLWGIHLSRFFTFLILSKWRETVAVLTCLRHFSYTLTWILLNNCLQLFVVKTTQPFFTLLFIFKALITTTKFLEPPLYFTVTCRPTSPCSVDIDRSFGGTAPKFEVCTT